jgi:hypothetical protein
MSTGCTVPAADQPQRGVARSSDEVIAALVHQRQHLVRVPAVLTLTLQPVSVSNFVTQSYLVALAALDVAGPRNDVDLTFERRGRCCCFILGRGRCRRFLLAARRDDAAQTAQQEHVRRSGGPHKKLPMKDVLGRWVRRECTRPGIRLSRSQPSSTPWSCVSVVAARRVHAHNRAAMSDPTVLLLSRIQFGFVMSFHIIFPLHDRAGELAGIPGRLYLQTGRVAVARAVPVLAEDLRDLLRPGVVSGIVMSFQFGTNWAELSKHAGNILGPLLAYEVLTAFFSKPPSSA